MQRRSVFDLPRKATQLSSVNDGMAHARYRQVSATKDVTGHQFSQGAQQFRFDTSGNTWFLPAMSYMRLRCTLTQVREDGGPLLPPLTSSDLAPNMGLAANLFKSVEVQLNGRSLERIAERLPQVDALKTRMRNARGWLDHLGQTTNFWGQSFDQRRAAVAVDGVDVAAGHDPPRYGPVLSQGQAGFDPRDKIVFNNTNFILTVIPEHANSVDLRRGAMALRPGDRVIKDDHVLKIVHVIDATRAFAVSVQTNHEGRRGIHDGHNRGVDAWCVQRLRDSPDNRALGKNQFEVIWRPPLGFFDTQHAIPPGGEWVLTFQPHNERTYKKNAVESTRTDLEPVSLAGPTRANQFDFQVDELQLYVYTVDADRFDQGDWFLDLAHTRCQLQTLPVDCTSLVQKTFDVHGKTTHLTMAFQDQAEGQDTRYSRSKFKIRPAPLEEKHGGSPDGQDLGLERFFVHYGQEQKPTPDFDGGYGCASSETNHQAGYNYLVHRYVDSLMNADLFHSEGGPESFVEWLRRGPYYHFRWPKDATDQSTRASVTFKFAKPFAEGLQHQVMLFHQWRTAVKISHKQGRVDVATMREF